MGGIVLAPQTQAVPVGLFCGERRKGCRVHPCTFMDFVKSQWNELWRSSPGRRFQTRYELSQTSGPSSTPIHFLRLAAGVLTAGVGMILLVTPGPGLLFLIAGGSLLASESRSIAERLDHWELVARDGAQRLWACTGWGHLKSKP